MITITTRVNANAQSIAPAAQMWINHTTHATVTHVFERSCNLVNQEGQLLALVVPELGNGPFAMVVTPEENAAQDSALDFTRLVKTGDRVANFEGVLRAGRLAVNTLDANGWRPRPRWKKLVKRQALLKVQVPSLQLLLATHAPRGSFADLPIVRGSLKPMPMSSITSTEQCFLRAATDPARILCLGASIGNLDACREAASALAGLGMGLTPSGDDFIMGALYALWATRSEAQAVSIGLALAELVKPLTNRLSGHWLAAAAHGEAGQLWHELVDALLDRDRVAVANTVVAMAGVGHTSGADALAGFVGTLQLV